MRRQSACWKARRRAADEEPVPVFSHALGMERAETPALPAGEEAVGRGAPLHSRDEGLRGTRRDRIRRDGIPPESLRTDPPGGPPRRVVRRPPTGCRGDSSPRRVWLAAERPCFPAGPESCVGDQFGVCCREILEASTPIREAAGADGACQSAPALVVVAWPPPRSRRGAEPIPARVRGRRSRRAEPPVTRHIRAEPWDR